MISIYLDVCCLNRPFDGQNQDRVRLETAAILTILKRIEHKEFSSISSSAIQAEINSNQNQDHKSRLQRFADMASATVRIEQRQIQRANELQRLGFHFFDALHIACAEAAAVDILLTTDDRFLRLAIRLRHQIAIRIANPSDWLMEIIDNDK